MNDAFFSRGKDTQGAHFHWFSAAQPNHKRLATWIARAVVVQHLRGNGAGGQGMATSRASFYHSCLKVPVHPDTRMPSPGYERPSLTSDSPSPVRIASRASRIVSRTSSASVPRSRASSARVSRPPSAVRYWTLTLKKIAIILFLHFFFK